MTEPDDTGLHPPAAPHLVAPTEEAVIAGANVTFVWEPVEAATAYRLEVASDAAFETVVFERQVGEATSLTVTDVFPPDESTYYWRVFARNESGESLGDVIESFISGTAADAAHHYVQPDQAEKMGPLAMLMTEGLKERTPDAGHGPEQPGIQFEGIGVAPILGFIFIILLLIAALVVFGINWSRSTVLDTREAVAATMAYPELRQVEMTADRQLTRYEAVNAELGIYRIPIDRAMALLVDASRGAPSANYSQELQGRPGN